MKNKTYCSPRGRSVRRRSLGLSLVELMIAMTLGLVVLLAVGEVYLSSSRTYRTQEALSRLQESARYALETLGYDIRMAGQVGCGFDKTQSVNVLNDISVGDFFGAPIRGIGDGGAIPSPFTAAPLRGDAVQVIRADEENETIVNSHVGASATFGFADTTTIVKGEVVIVTDCQTAAVFQATNPSTPGDTLVHSTGVSGVTPGNCSKSLSFTTPACGVAAGKEFPKGSKVYKMLNNLYYLFANPAGEPALYRQGLVKGEPVSGEELVEGVEDMRISYGLDTNGDKAVDSTVGTAAVTNWDQVQTVQISLLMRSDNNAVDQPQTYTFNGTTTTPTDRRIRKVFNATIAVRSRQ